MQDNFEKEHVGHRERLFYTLSLGLALVSKIIVPFDSSSNDKLQHTGRMELLGAMLDLRYLREHFYGDMLFAKRTWKMRTDGNDGYGLVC